MSWDLFRNRHKPKAELFSNVKDFLFFLSGANVIHFSLFIITHLFIHPVKSCHFSVQIPNTDSEPQVSWWPDPFPSLLPLSSFTSTPLTSTSLHSATAETTLQSNSRLRAFALTVFSAPNTLFTPHINMVHPLTFKSSFGTCNCLSWEHSSPPFSLLYFRLIS